MSIPIECVKTRSWSMEYFRFGEGRKTMVILPGISVKSVMGFADAVAKQYEIFAKEYTVYVFDRRDPFPESYPVREMAEDTVTAMEILGLSDIDLFGASQGGMMALEIAIRHPALVRKMILGSTTAYNPDSHFRAFEDWLAPAREKDGVGLYLAFGKALYPEAVFESYRDVLTETGKSVTEKEMDRFLVMAKAAEGFDVRAGLGKIACPVLVLYSKDDEVLGEASSKELIEALQEKEGCGSYGYEGYGHAVYDLAPDYPQRMYDFFVKGQIE